MWAECEDVPTAPLAAGPLDHHRPTTDLLWTYHGLATGNSRLSSPATGWFEGR